MNLHDLIDEIDYQGTGSRPVVRFESWRILMNRCENPPVIDESATMGRHLCTDESFVLLEGEAKILIAEGTDAPENIRAVQMVPHRLYNVKQGVFHQVVAAKGALILIVENDDTSWENSQKAPIGEAQLKHVLALLEPNSN